MNIINNIKKEFEGDHTLKIKEISISNYLLYVVYINGLSDEAKIADFIIRPIINNDDIIVLLPNQKKVTYNEGINNLISGEALLIYDDTILSIDCKNSPIRGFSEPESETVEKGPKLGFVENILFNITLIRSNLKSSKIKIKYIELDGENKNKMAIMYVDNLVDKKVLEELENRINKILPITTLDPNMIREKIKDHPYSSYKTIGSTERPDVAINKLLDGKIVLFVDGSPTCLTLPFIFKENFISPDDYYINFYYSSFNRLIRILCFLISILLPGFYLSLIMYHQELIPTKLAMSLISSRMGVSFPSFVEILFLLISFDIIRETGSKIPSSLGTALSIVAGIVLGQAVVEAKIVSTAVIIITSLSSLTGIINTNVKSTIIIWRIIIFFFALIMGFHGFLTGLILFIIYLVSIKSFNEEYLKDFFNFDIKRYKDTYIRYPFKGDKK